MQKLDPGSYFGRTSDLYANAGLSVAETLFPATFEIPPHEHANPFFCFVLAGNGTRSWPGRSGTEQPMSLTVFPAELPHANRWFGTGGRVMHVEFASPWLEKLRGMTKVLDRPADFSAGPPVWFAQRMNLECRDQDDVSPLVIEGLMLEMLAECSRMETSAHARRVPPWLTRAQRVVQDRRTEKLSLAEIADACGVSADYLARAFRRHFGCTVGEYIRRLRVDDACRRLAGSNTSLAEIALATGFTDQSHFTKVFQRLMRMTPNKFRLEQQGSRLRTK